MNSKDRIDFAMLFTLWTSLFELRPNMSGTPEDFRFCVVKGSNQASLFELRPDRVKYYDVTLDALTLKPSDVCNVGVNCGSLIHKQNQWSASLKIIRKNTIFLFIVK
ncbi:MAG: hypothetical protein PVH85_01380 [Desulfobacterales bacterium]